MGSWSGLPGSLLPPRRVEKISHPRPTRGSVRHARTGFGFGRGEHHRWRNAEHRYARTSQQRECRAVRARGLAGSFHSNDQHTWLILADCLDNRIARLAVLYDAAQRKALRVLQPELLGGCRNRIQKRNRLFGPPRMHHNQRSVERLSEEQAVSEASAVASLRSMASMMGPPGTGR